MYAFFTPWAALHYLRAARILKTVKNDPPPHFFLPPYNLALPPVLNKALKNPKNIEIVRELIGFSREGNEFEKGARN